MTSRASSSTVIAPGSHIGILGGGQLGRMSAMAAAHMGYHVHIYDPKAGCPASQVTAHFTCAPYDDESALLAFAAAVDVVTLEFENIPYRTAELLGEHVPVRPGWDVLKLSQNRAREKQALHAIDIRTAPFAIVRSADDALHAAETIGTPAILKSSESGYDGKGQIRILTQEEALPAWQSLAVEEAVWEGLVDFACEISVLVARTPSGECTCYPPALNEHRNQILHKTTVPAPIAAEVAAEATRIATHIATQWQVEGLLAVEIFVTHHGDILVNEIAPRPHNSGHWTLDACATSQFEQHIRAVCNLPLGSTPPLCKAEMVNLLGRDGDQWQALLANPDAKLHLYGKDAPLDGRKMGHITTLFPNG